MDQSYHSLQSVSLSDGSFKASNRDISPLNFNQELPLKLHSPK